MGWLLTCNSDHPLTKVSLLYADIIFSEAFIEVNFLRCHGFGFNDSLDTIFLTYFNKELFNLVSILCSEHFTTTSLDVGFELVSQLLNMLYGISLHATEIFTKLLNILACIGLQTGTRILICKAGQGILHDVILQL